MSQSTIFQSSQDGSLGLTITNQWIKCLAEGHNTVASPAVSLEQATLQSQVYSSTN